MLFACRPTACSAAVFLVAFFGVHSFVPIAVFRELCLHACIAGRTGRILVLSRWYTLKKYLSTSPRTAAALVNLWSQFTSGYGCGCGCGAYRCRVRSRHFGVGTIVMGTRLSDPIMIQSKYSYGRVGTYQ